MLPEQEGDGAVDLRKCRNCSEVFAARVTGGAPQRYCSEACRKQGDITRRKGPSRPGRGKRRPLPEFASSAGWALRKDIERIERIVADDRFAENKDRVAAQLSGHLQYAAEVCQDLLSRIATTTGG